MQPTVNMLEEPFSRLSEAEQALIKKNANIAFFVKNEIIINAGETSKNVYLIFKGEVVKTSVKPKPNHLPEEKHISEYYTTDDLFGVHELQQAADEFMICLEETLCFCFEASVFDIVLRSNKGFADYFHSRIHSAKQALTAENVEMNFHAMAKISDFSLRPAVIVDAKANLRDVSGIIVQEKVNSVLVREDSRFAILTKTDLLKAFADKLEDSRTAADIATWEPISISHNDILMNALILMEKNNIERLPVKEGEGYKAILELKQMMYAFSSMSYSIGLQIDHAGDIADLRRLAEDFKPLINSLLFQGVEVVHIMEMVSVINRKMLKKLAELIIPENLLANMCFFVMGSEGRGEQMLKTDQDNGAVYADHIRPDEIQPYADKITATLLELGYPTCPGNIMICNPEWCMSVSNWKQKISGWTHSVDMSAIMSTAIFYDACPIAGKPEMLEEIVDYLTDSATHNPIFYMYFAKAALQFESALTFFGGIKVHKDGLDLKKGGIFPIVHGIRTMSLQHKITKKNTLDRTRLLAEKHIITQRLGKDIPEAFNVLLKVRLKQRLERLKNHGCDDTPDLLQVSRLNRIERDMLREALVITKDFKLFLADHFQMLT